MEGPLFQPPMPFRPIPVYGQRIPQQASMQIPSPDGLHFVGKGHMDGLSLTKQFNLISHMNQIRSLSEYQLGQIGRLGTITPAQHFHGINKFTVKNLASPPDRERSHAIAQSGQQVPEPSKVFGFHEQKSHSEHSVGRSVNMGGDKDKSLIDRMTVPVIVSCANPFVSQYGYGRKVFPCPQCRYTTDRRNNLKRHMLTMHQTCSKTLECCGIVFATKALLREHAMIFHYHGYTCFYCGRRFCRKALLKRHLSVHNGQKDFVCPVCDYATSHKSNLERHRKVHCRPDEDKGEEMHCGTETGGYLQKTLAWGEERGSDVYAKESDIAETRVSESDDDEDEEINVDSD